MRTGPRYLRPIIPSHAGIRIQLASEQSKAELESKESGDLGFGCRGALPRGSPEKGKETIPAQVGLVAHSRRHCWGCIQRHNRGAQEQHARLQQQHKRVVAAAATTRHPCIRCRSYYITCVAGDRVRRCGRCGRSRSREREQRVHRGRLDDDSELQRREQRE